MAASPGVPLPGTECGPCVEECLHRDCQANRALAGTGCRICGVLIGYETRYYQERDGDGFKQPVHALCLELENE